MLIHLDIFCLFKGTHSAKELSFALSIQVRLLHPCFFLLQQTHMSSAGQTWEIRRNPKSYVNTGGVKYLPVFSKCDWIDNVGISLQIMQAMKEKARIGKKDSVMAPSLKPPPLAELPRWTGWCQGSAPAGCPRGLPCPVTQWRGRHTHRQLSIIAGL